MSHDAKMNEFEKAVRDALAQAGAAVRRGNDPDFFADFHAERVASNLRDAYERAYPHIIEAYDRSVEPVDYGVKGESGYSDGGHATEIGKLRAEIAELQALLAAARAGCWAANTR